MIPSFIDTSHTTCRDVFADLVSSSNRRFAFNMVQRFTSSNLGILVDFIHISSIPTCNYTVNTTYSLITCLLRRRTKGKRRFLGITCPPGRVPQTPSGELRPLHPLFCQVDKAAKVVYT